MVNYKCPNCSKQFTRKSNYDYHLYKKKTPCSYVKLSTENIAPRIPQKRAENSICPKCGKTYASNSNLRRHLLNNCTSNDTRHKAYVNAPQDTSQMIKCEHCDKLFTRIDNLNRHKKNHCHIKKRQDTEIEEKYDELLKKLDEQSKEIQELKQQLNNTGDTNCHNTTTNNNNTINNNGNTTNVQNINILKFGEENLEYLDDKTIKYILDRGRLSVPCYVQYTHFLQSHPENHNIYISNERSKYIQKFTGQRWINVERDEAIHELYIDGRDFLVDKYDELKDELSKSTTTKFGRFKANIEVGNVNTIKDAKEDIRRLLYNKRDIPIKTRKEMEKRIKNK